MRKNYQSGAKKTLAKTKKVAEATRNCLRLSSWLIQLEISEHKHGLTTARQVASVSCVSDDDNYTTQTVIGQKLFP